MNVGPASSRAVGFDAERMPASAGRKDSMRKVSKNLPLLPRTIMIRNAEIIEFTRNCTECNLAHATATLIVAKPPQRSHRPNISRESTFHISGIKDAAIPADADVRLNSLARTHRAQ
jgi:hypothetical protein